jgi:large subunit ribosomal protein L24
MKIKFSKAWIASKQPRKQRKYLANAPIHIKKKMVGANLSKELRKKYGKRSMTLRKGDTVKIMRGKFKKKEGKVTSVSPGTFNIQVEGIQRKKQDGSKVNVKLQPSNLQIILLNLEDSKRSEFLKKPAEERKQEDKTEKSKSKLTKKQTEETENAP